MHFFQDKRGADFNLEEVTLWLEFAFSAGCPSDMPIDSAILQSRIRSRFEAGAFLRCLLEARLSRHLSKKQHTFCRKLQLAPDFRACITERNNLFFSMRFVRHSDKDMLDEATLAFCSSGDFTVTRCLLYIHALNRLLFCPNCDMLCEIVTTTRPDVVFDVSVVQDSLFRASVYIIDEQFFVCTCDHLLEFNTALWAHYFWCLVSPVSESTLVTFASAATTLCSLDGFTVNEKSLRDEFVSTLQKLPHEDGAHAFQVDPTESRPDGCHKGKRNVTHIGSEGPIPSQSWCTNFLDTKGAFCLAFPHLFPLGRGDYTTFDDQQKKLVPFPKWLGYLLRYRFNVTSISELDLSGLQNVKSQLENEPFNRFEADPTFVLFCFTLWFRQRCKTGTYLAMRGETGLASWSAEDIVAGMKAQDAALLAKMNLFHRSIEGTPAFWRSRVKHFVGTGDQFKPGTYMWFISNSFADTKVHWLPEKLPVLSTKQSSAQRNATFPASLACLFALLGHVVKDVIIHGFLECENYMERVEEQNRGMFHWHILASSAATPVESQIEINRYLKERLHVPCDGIAAMTLESLNEKPSIAEAVAYFSNSYF